MLIKGHHLTYCSNIHSGETWIEVFENLRKYIPLLKSKISAEHSFGIGLRLSNIAAQELSIAANLQEFLNWLLENDCYVFTMNGFPYGSFHGLQVKDQVHAPDWTSSHRVEYTSRLIKLMAALLPANAEGGISISPISYKPWLAVKDYPQVFAAATAHLMGLVKELYGIEKTSGKTIHLDLEPEPDGLIENSAEVLTFFNEYLLKEGAELLAKSTGIDIEYAKKIILKHIQICYDVCHFSLSYESPKMVIADFENNNIKIGKIQISAALKAAIPSELSAREALIKALAPFAESTYLHQVSGLLADGSFNQYRDLPEALILLPSSREIEWKTHFHVPVFLETYGLLSSTQSDIVEVLSLLKDNNFTQHLEIETYTWEVLPAEMKTTIEACIQREYEWVIGNL